MTDKPDTPQILDEIAKSTSAQPGPRSARQQRNSRRRFLVLILLLLPLLAVTGFIGYQQWLVQSLMSTLNAENQSLRNSLDSQSGQLTRLQDELTQVSQRAGLPAPVDTSAVQASEARLTQEIERLSQALAQLQRQQQQLQLREATEPNMGWKLREADYLIALAARKLELEGDVTTAILLLEDADAALLASAQGNVFAAREALAVDLSNLRELDLLDRDGLYLRMGNLLTRLAQVDLLDSMRQDFENRRSTSSQPVAIGDGENGLFQSSVNFLSSVFVWRRWEETPEAMLVPGQEALIKQNLRLMLEQARLALYARDNGLYRNSLSNIVTELERYSVMDAGNGEAILRELDQLLAIDVDPPLPTLARTSTLVSQLVASEL